MISYGFAGAGAWGAPVAQGAGVGGAGRERRRCGLAGASARQEMTRGLAVIPSSEDQNSALTTDAPLQPTQCHIE